MLILIKSFASYNLVSSETTYYSNYEQELFLPPLGRFPFRSSFFSFSPFFFCQEGKKTKHGYLEWKKCVQNTVTLCVVVIPVTSEAS